MSQQTLHKIRKDRGSLIIWLAVLSLIIIGVTKLLGQEAIIIWIEKAGIRGPILIIFLRVLTTIFPITGTPAYIASGAIFGFWPAFMYNAIGNIIGMTFSFRIARKRGYKVVRKIIGKDSADKVVKLLHKLDNIKTFIVSRTLLFFLEDLFNYAAGMSSIKYRYFITISMIITSIASIFLIQAGVALVA